MRQVKIIQEMIKTVASLEHRWRCEFVKDLSNLRNVIYDICKNKRMISKIREAKKKKNDEKRHQLARRKRED